MSPPPLSHEEERRLRDLELWRKEHDAVHAGLREELTLKVADMNDAAIRHVERAVAEGLKPVSQVKDELVVIKAQNVAQMSVLEGQNRVLETTNVELHANRVEREKRVAADEAKATVEKDARDTRDADLAAKGERTKRLAVYATIVVALVGGLVALVVAALSSHH